MSAAHKLAFLLLLVTILGSVTVLIRGGGSSPEITPERPASAIAEQIETSRPAASTPAPKTTAPDSGVERELSPTNCGVRLALGSAPASGAEVFLLAWTEQVRNRAFSMEGLSKSLIHREAHRLTADESGLLQIPTNLAPLFLAVRAPGSAPYGALFETLPPTIELDLPREETLRGRVLAVTEMPAVQARVTARRAYRTECSYREISADDPQRIASMFFESQVDVQPDGSFQIGGLPAGRVWVMAHGNGTASNQHTEWSVPRDDEIELLLTGAHTLSGRVVRSSTGEPIEGAFLSSAFWEGNTKIIEMAVTTTDEDGHFLLEGVPDGPAGRSLRLVREGFATRIERLPDLMTSSDRQNLLFHMEDACSAGGTALSADGQPIADAYVQVHDGETSELMNWTKSDGDGQFTLTFLAPEKTYELVGSAKGYYIQRLPALELCGQDDIELVFDPLASLVGTVITESPPVRAARARLVLENEYGHRLRTEFADVDGDSGEFAFSRLGAGVYVLDVEAEGYAPARIEKVAVEDGEEPNQIEVTLNRGSTLRGRVHSRATLQPVVGATVTLGDIDAYDSVAGPLPTAPETTTDGEGRYLLEHVPTGTPFRLLVEHPDYSLVTEEVLVERGQLAATCDVELVPSASVSVSIRDESGQLFTRFYADVWAPNGETRNALASGGSHRFDNIPPGLSTVAVSLGERIRAGIGRQAFYREVLLSAGEHAHVEFTLQGGARIHGRIRGPALQTQTFSFALVVSREETQECSDFATRVGLDSSYVLAGIPPGTWIVHLEADATRTGVSIPKRVELVANSDVELDFQVLLAGFEGTVTSRDGQRLAGALVWVAPWDDGMFITGSRSRVSRLMAYATESGEYGLLGMAPGQYVYTVEFDGYGLEQGLLEIPDEETILQKDFTLEPEGRIEVMLLDRSGSKVQEAACTIRRSDSDSILRLSQLDEYLPDRRIFAGATTGIYTIQVQAEGFFPAESQAECRSGKTTTTSLTLRRPGSLHLRILSKEGMTLPDFPLLIIDMETGTDVAEWIQQGLVTSTTSSTVTDDVGELTLQNLPEGRFQIQSQNLTATVTVNAGALTGPEVLQQSP